MTEPNVPALRDALKEGVPGREAVLAKFDSIEALTRGYHELEQLQRSGQPRWPGPNATVDQLRQYHDAIGVPKSASEYEVPAGVKIENQELLTSLREAAIAAGVPKSSFPAIAKTLEKANPKDPTESWRAEAKTMWGEKYESNLAVAKSAVDRLIAVTPGFKKALEETKAGDHPGMLAALYELGKKMANDTTPGPTSVGGVTLVSAKKLAAEARKLYGSPATDSKNHPEYRASVERIHAIKAELKELGYTDLGHPDLQDDPFAGPRYLTPSPAQR